MATIKDISQKLGISHATVSYVLNGRASQFKIRDEVCRRIHETARELGYTRNMPAALLRRGCMPAVRVLLPAWGSAEIQQLAKGISDASLELGYPLLIHYYAKDTDYISFLRQSCQGKNIGVLFYLHARMNREALQRECDAYLAGGGKMVFMNPWSADFTGIVPDMVMLNIDEEYGGQLAGDYLKSRSCRRYSIVYSSTDRYSCLRRKGFAANLGGEDKLCYSFDFRRVGENYPQYQARSRRLLDDFYETAVRDNPTPHGIFFTSFFMADAVMNDLQLRGMKDETQIHAVGFSGNIDLHYPFYYYAKIVIPFYEIGNTAMKKLVHMLDGKAESSQMFRPSIFYDYNF